MDKEFSKLIVGLTECNAQMKKNPTKHKGFSILGDSEI